tara:strand:+ start:3316 stop:3960 length:645 start_codon:yes stop_codon:yes gene_type:complete
MVKTLKVRKAPPSSATKFNVGTKKKGKDGNMWKIVQNKNGTKRWLKISKVNSKTKYVSNKETTKKSTDLSIETLKQMKKKYSVLTSGSKKDIAYGLWRVSGHTMTDKDLALISYLLPRKDQKIIEKKIKFRSNNTITNFKGLWKPLPKPLSKMSREELIRNLRLFRDAWEKITTRNQDLDNERLATETTEQLRKLLKFYYSDEAKLIAEDWLRK